MKKKQVRPTTLPEGVTDRDLTLLVRGLSDLFNCAHKEDILKTAAHLVIGEEQVRRYLRGLVYSYETAKDIHDYLRDLTIKRSHKIQHTLAA